VIVGGEMAKTEEQLQEPVFETEIEEDDFSFDLIPTDDVPRARRGQKKSKFEPKIVKFWESKEQSALVSIKGADDKKLESIMSALRYAVNNAKDGELEGKIKVRKRGDELYLEKVEKSDKAA
jgi:hypothetical protein